MSGTTDAAGNGQQRQLTRRERNQLQQKRKELLLIEKRLNCPTELKLKFILVGNSGVGKTSLIQKYSDNKADIRNVQSTIFVDFVHCRVNLTGKSIQIRMWDTCGVERYHDCNLSSNFFRNSDGVMMVYSVDDHESFTALPKWLERVRENVGPNSPFDCCIVGNKSDRSNGRLVSRQEAERFAYHLGFPYIETSALDVVNVHKAFTDLALAVIKRYEVTQQVMSSAFPGARASFRLSKQSRNDSASSGRRCGCN